MMVRIGERRLENGNLENEWVKTITDQVRYDGMEPEVAIEKITESGDFLAIGTARTSRYHRPMPSLVARETPDVEWQHRLPSRFREGAVPILRAGKIAKTAIHAAFGGDINIPHQRILIDELLVPEHAFYQGETHGWDYDPVAHEYQLAVHQDYVMSVMEQIPDEQHVGDVDFVHRNNFGISIPAEPGHYASEKVEERVGSLPITLGDAYRNMASSAIRYMRYQPLSLPRD